MVVNEYSGLSFLHPMKTGMTSVESFLRLNIRREFGDNKVMDFTDHRTPNEIMWRFDYTESFFRNHYFILFVRNPYDRLVSFYHHMRQIGGHAEGICKRLSFEEFIKYPYLRSVVRPMSDYCYYNDENIINFTGHIETIDKDVFKLIDTYGFKDPEQVKTRWLNYPHLQSTKHKPSVEYYNNDLKERVYSLYRIDFILFGYEGI